MMQEKIVGPKGLGCDGSQEEKRMLVLLRAVGTHPPGTRGGKISEGALESQ